MGNGDGSSTTQNPEIEQALVKKAQEEAAEAAARKRMAEANARKAEAEAEKAAEKPDPRLKQAELNKQIAEAEKQAAQAHLDKLKAELPAGTTKPLEGKITADAKFGYVAELATYNALSQAATEIAASIAGKVESGSKVLLVDSLDIVRTGVEVDRVKTQLDQLEQKLNEQHEANEKLLEPPKTEKFASSFGFAELAIAASSLVSTAADLVGYFRSNYDIKGRDVKVEDDTIRLQVAGLLSNPPGEGNDTPEGIEVHLMDFRWAISAPVVENLSKCAGIRTELLADVAALKSLSSPGVEVTNAIARSEALVKAFDTFYDALINLPQGADRSLLSIVAAHQQIDAIDPTYLLYVTVSSSGGEAITKQSIWSSGSTAFLGGGAVSFVLVHKDGKVVDAGMVQKLSYLKFRLGQEYAPEFK